MVIPCLNIINCWQLVNHITCWTRMSNITQDTSLHVLCFFLSLTLKIILYLWLFYGIFPNSPIQNMKSASEQKIVLTIFSQKTWHKPYVARFQTTLVTSYILCYPRLFTFISKHLSTRLSIFLWISHFYLASTVNFDVTYAVLLNTGNIRSAKQSSIGRWHARDENLEWK